MKLERAMGILYSDVGQLRVVSVEAKTSVAEVVFSCDYLLRGDIVRPFEERAAPPFKEVGPFEHFAPVSGKPVGMVVTAKAFRESQAQGYTMYVNLGAAQGVKVGDYLRIFRYQGKNIEYPPQTKGYAYQIEGSRAISRGPFFRIGAGFDALIALFPRAVSWRAEARPKRFHK